MESFLSILGLLLFWRTAVATTVALVVAITLAVRVSWFTGGHGLALVLLAFGAGLLWESSARPRGGERASAATVKLSAPVAALALAFLGAIAGAWAGAAAGSWAAGALALAIGAAAVGVYSSRMDGRAFAWRAFVYSTACLLFGFGCIAALGALRA
jgi:hypothetical protein